MFELENRARRLAEALKRSIGSPDSGSMVYVRCLLPSLVREFAGIASFTVPGWDLWIVTNVNDRPNRFITADEAVEIREEKGPATILLVDRDNAGAGMDGIYSAVRELGEEELFKKAKDLALAEIKYGYKTFVQNAVRRARRLGRYNSLSPWREFNFYSFCADNPDTIGSQLGLIGLWPTDLRDELKDDVLDQAAVMVERLLLMGRADETPEARVAALMLPERQQLQATQLVQFLRKTARLHSNEVLEKLLEYPQLRLNSIEPGLFDQRQLQRLELQSWRAPRGSVFAWSGLGELDGRLRFILNREPQTPKDRSRLEIRWRSLPDGLEKGSLDYRIEVLSGEEILAEKTTTHTGNDQQRVAFVLEDFDELDENSRFEARVRVLPIGRDQLVQESEDFILDFGASNSTAKSGAGMVVPSMVHALSLLESEEDFTEACRQFSDSKVFSRDSKGHITFRFKDQKAKVAVPALLRELSDDWAKRGGEPGRWQTRVRADGTAVGSPEFISIQPTRKADSFWDKLVAASRTLSVQISSGAGFAALVHGSGDGTSDYVNAWANVLEQNTPEFALAHTLEVRSLGGQTIGIVVLPTHPLRVAWQQGYDQLVAHSRYKEKLSSIAIRTILKGFEGAHFPAFLPGLEGVEAFVFGDVLGFGAIAMVPDTDWEPKTTVSLLSQLILSESSDVAEVTAASEHAIAQEIERYLSLHPEYNRLVVHALRAGNGATVARALGEVVRGKTQDKGEVEDETGSLEKLSFVVQFHPGSVRSETTGRYLASLAERRRANAGAVPETERWMLESLTRAGGASMPRLSWAKREKPEPVDPAHLSLAFDTFRFKVVAEPSKSLSSKPLEVYGFSAPMVRDFATSPEPEWRSYAAPTSEGEKHPTGRGPTDRLTRIHNSLLRATSMSIGGDESSWPVLLTNLDVEKQDSIRQLHVLSDWVVTVDRNVGIEYFDSPNERPAVYETYVIDCVPERQDLNYLQLVTSTGRIEEVVNLLDLTLADLNLSSSRRNCIFLLNELKGLSGRFAMRLSQDGNQSQELIALALTHHHCSTAQVAPVESPWLPLSDGFFVPLDELATDAGKVHNQEPSVHDGRRADLVYVTYAKKGGLRFAFVEVKYRRYLKTARDFELLEEIWHQIGASRKRWSKQYGDDVSSLEKSIHRVYFARLLQFYAMKGRRHHLSEDAFRRILRELDRMVRDGGSYQLKDALSDDSFDRGFVFCPEYASDNPSNLSSAGQIAINLFGPSQLPDAPTTTYAPASLPSVAPDVSIKTKSQIRLEPSPAKDDVEEIVDATSTPQKATEIPIALKPSENLASVVLGKISRTNGLLSWQVSIKANPHLLMVGLPGMGKTTSLINICVQLVSAGVTPIVFSYHEDIDAALTQAIPDKFSLLDCNELGFNPMRVIDRRPTAYVDNVSTLRDVFAAIFPDLGDVQLGRVREALKQSYDDLGWSGELKADQEFPTPDFQSFYHILKTQSKPDRGLLTRFAELDDYGFFKGTSGAKNLLETANPSILRIHTTQNEVLQRAFAIFVLHNIYKGMFARGLASRITHVVVFDEAHRAAKLKLIATMAKECRKYGISMVIASQETKDFDPSLYNAIANYLCLRLNEGDARVMAKTFADTNNAKRITDQIKSMPKHEALFFGEGQLRPSSITLSRWQDLANETAPNNE